MNINFLDHDSHEHGLTLTQRVAEVTIDLQLAQRMRDAMRAQGMRVPLTEDETKVFADAFAEADARMRSRA
jgi:N-acetylmuramoyl-L-alanine amidase